MYQKPQGLKNEYVLIEVWTLPKDSLAFQLHLLYKHLYLPPTFGISANPHARKCTQKEPKENSMFSVYGIHAPQTGTSA